MASSWGDGLLRQGRLGGLVGAAQPIEHWAGSVPAVLSEGIAPSRSSLLACSLSVTGVGTPGSGHRGIAAHYLWRTLRRAGLGTAAADPHPWLPAELRLHRDLREHPTRHRSRWRARWGQRSAADSA